MRNMPPRVITKRRSEGQKWLREFIKSKFLAVLRVEGKCKFIEGKIMLRKCSVKDEE